MFLAERRLNVGFFGIGGGLPNRPAMIGPEMIGNRYPHWSYREPRFAGTTEAKLELKGVEWVFWLACDGTNMELLF